MAGKDLSEAVSCEDTPMSNPSIISVDGAIDKVQTNDNFVVAFEVLDSAAEKDQTIPKKILMDTSEGKYKLEKEKGPLSEIYNPANPSTSKTFNNVVFSDEDNANSKLNKEQVPGGSDNSKYPLFADDIGPYWYKVKNNLVTKPIIGKNLPKIFEQLPVTGAPECAKNLEEFYDKKIREFVNLPMNDQEYKELVEYCQIEHLFVGKELKMTTKIPSTGLITKQTVNFSDDSDSDDTDDIPGNDDDAEANLVTLQKLKMRLQRDVMNTYPKRLKYRSMRLMPMSEQEADNPELMVKPPDLEPGKDVLYRVRVFRPFAHLPVGGKSIRGRHSVFSYDLVVVGRQPLTALRDRISCRNDNDMRMDVSNHPDKWISANASTVFPSGLLFINNIFYVDSRSGCKDISAVIRKFAAEKGIGQFPVRDMAEYTFDDITVKLAHPDVYLHQGNCEHIFVFSEIRLLNASDPLHITSYPCHTAVSLNQTIYCTTCAEFNAKWLVTGCDRVPFDPAFFCETCFRQYLYIGGKKIGDFKAYSYTGNNEIFWCPKK